jgi:ADP-ribose pyrophosphatase YjhB (NUDIX family)
LKKALSLTTYLKTDPLAARFFSLIKSLRATQLFREPCNAAFAMVFCLHGGVLRVMTNVENRPKFNVFGLPGGVIEKKHSSEIDDESGRLTAERETREETGVDLTKLSKTQHIYTFSLGHGISYVVYFSENRMPNGAPWRKNKEVSAVCHMRFSNVFSMLLASNNQSYQCGPHNMRLRECYREVLLQLWSMMHPE